MPTRSLSTAAADLAARAHAAADRIRPHVRRTPLVPSARLGAEVGGEVLLKLESLQATGSFKLRGAFARLTAGDAPPARVVTASTGNHGAAVAHAAHVLGVEAVVYVPSTADATKRARIERLGARVLVAGEDCVEAEAAARARAEEEGVLYVSPYNDLEVAAGQGTLAVELLEERGVAGAPIDAISIAVGGGGLLAGTAAVLRAAWPGVRILGASPERSQVMLRSVAAGHLVPDEGLSTLSDGTAGGLEPGTCTLPLCAELVDEWIAVPEEEIAAQMRAALLEDHLVIEGAAGVAAAALVRAARTRPIRAGVVLVCGGNVAPEKLAAVLAGAGPGNSE